MFHQKLKYILQNPVEAGFVTKQEEYLYSSARNYYEGKGLIEPPLLISTWEIKSTSEMLAPESKRL